MSLTTPISGIYTALITPFTRSGAIAWPAFDKLLSLQAQAGVDGVVICGTTGESPTLSVDEKLSLFRRARAQLPANVKMMAGTGGSCTKQSVELSRLAQDAGADSLLIVTPPYNKPSREGLSAHFAAITASVSIPLCLYHVPSRTGLRLSAEDLASLCELESIKAVKEASGDLFLFSKARNLSKAAYLSGDDFTFLPSLSVGGVGVISVLTNIFPLAFVKMYHHFRANELREALHIHESLLPLIELLFVESSPAPTKALLHHMGIAENVLRLPLVPTTQATLEKLIAGYQEVKNQLLQLGAHV